MEFTQSARGFYVGLMLLLPAIAVVNALIHGIVLRRFLKRTPALNTSQNIADFEKVVARQMYAALVQIALLVAPGLVFVTGFVRGALSPGDIVYVLLPSIVVLVVGVVFKQIEIDAKSIPVRDSVLEKRRDHIVKVWNTKPFPDW